MDVGEAFPHDTLTQALESHCEPTCSSEPWENHDRYVWCIHISLQIFLSAKLPRCSYLFSSELKLGDAVLQKRSGA